MINKNIWSRKFNSLNTIFRIFLEIVEDKKVIFLTKKRKAQFWQAVDNRKETFRMCLEPITLMRNANIIELYYMFGVIFKEIQELKFQQVVYAINKKLYV